MMKKILEAVYFGVLAIAVILFVTLNRTGNTALKSQLAKLDSTNAVYKHKLDSMRVEASKYDSTINKLHDSASIASRKADSLQQRLGSLKTRRAAVETSVKELPDSALVKRFYQSL